MGLVYLTTFGLNIHGSYAYMLAHRRRPKNMLMSKSFFVGAHLVNHLISLFKSQFSIIELMFFPLCPQQTPCFFHHDFIMVALVAPWHVKTSVSPTRKCRVARHCCCVSAAGRRSGHIPSVSIQSRGVALMAQVNLTYPPNAHTPKMNPC